MSRGVSKRCFNQWITKNVRLINSWVSSFTSTSPGRSLNSWEKTVFRFNVHSFSFCFLSDVIEESSALCVFLQLTSSFSKILTVCRHFYILFYGNDQIISDKSHIFYGFWNMSYANHIYHLSSDLSPNIPKRTPTTGDYINKFWQMTVKISSARCCNTIKNWFRWKY